MAVKLNVTKVSRGDVYGFSPFEYRMKETNRGREFQPTEEELVSLALDMLNKGQLQNVLFRKIEDDIPCIVAGHRRCAAARLIRTGFNDAEGNFHQKEDFELKGQLLHGCNEEDAFLICIAENYERKQPSLIDHAANMKRLVNQYSKTLGEVAATYSCSIQTVSNYLKLLSLSREHQLQVHTGELPLSAALHLVDVPEERREEVLTTVKETKGKITGTAINALERETALKAKAEAEAKEREQQTQVNTQTEESTPPPTNGNGHVLANSHILNDDNRELPSPPAPVPPVVIKERPLTVREVKDFWVSQTESDNDVVHELALKMLDWLLGTVGSDDLSEHLHNLCQGKSPSE